MEVYFVAFKCVAIFLFIVTSDRWKMWPM